MPKLRGTVYNNIATEENLAKVNPDNLKLLDEWVMYLTAASRSPQTIYNYISDIRFFFVYLLQRCDNKFFGDIVSRDIVFFQTWCMNDLKLSNNRIRRLKDVVSSFSNYVEKFYKDDERLKDFKNITRVIGNPKREKSREETKLTDAEVKLIFEKLIDDCHYRTACLLALALYGGLRKAELVQIELATFEKSNITGSLYKSPHKITYKGGRKGTPYFLKHEVDRYIYLWKRERRRMFRRYGEPSKEIQKMLFLSRVENKWKVTQTQNMTYVAEFITQTMQKNGIDKVFYWESARNYFEDYVKRTVKSEEERKLLLQNM